MYVLVCVCERDVKKRERETQNMENTSKGVLLSSITKPPTT